MPPSAFAWEVQEEGDRRTYICAKFVHKEDADAFATMMRKRVPAKVSKAYTVQQAYKTRKQPLKPLDYVTKVKAQRKKL